MPEPNYYITPVNHPVFDEADPDRKKLYCLFGVQYETILPHLEIVFRDEHKDKRMEQLRRTIEQLERENTTVREKCIAEAQHETVIRVKHKDETIRQMMNELQTIREKHTTELETQLVNTRKRFEVEYQHLETMNVKLKEDIQRMMDERDKYVRDHVDRTVDVYKQQLEQEKDKMDIQRRLNLRLQDELDSMKSRRTNALVTVGSIAENEVEMYLGNMFTEGKLTNMSKTSENSDFHFEHNGVRILIEVKNYTNTIPQRPAIDKFLRDVVSTKVDGGIIVSCVDGVRFAFRKSVLDWDFHQNIPTLYLTDFFSNPHLLYGGVLALIHYIRYKKEFERENDQSAQEHKDMYLDILGEIETWVPLSEKATKYAKSTWEAVQELNQKIVTRLTKYDISTSALKSTTSHSSECNETDIMNAAMNCYHTLKYIPTAKELMEHANIKQSMIQKVGGIRAIRKHIEANQ
jgi:hypothetical protein